jgi:hypothetical protein
LPHDPEPLLLLVVLLLVVVVLPLVLVVLLLVLVVLPLLVPIPEHAVAQSEPAHPHQPFHSAIASADAFSEQWDTHSVALIIVPKQSLMQLLSVTHAESLVHGLALLSQSLPVELARQLWQF